MDAKNRLYEMLQKICSNNCGLVMGEMAGFYLDKVNIRNIIKIPLYFKLRAGRAMTCCYFGWLSHNFFRGENRRMVY